MLNNLRFILVNEIIVMYANVVVLLANEKKCFCSLFLFHEIFRTYSKNEVIPIGWKHWENSFHLIHLVFIHTVILCYSL